ncbi:MAG TPA: hypothetical protein PLL57_10165, partial [Flavobacteriales bacterium]|nr:hypothetical protein [Flavobacteriales bacterium]
MKTALLRALIPALILPTMANAQGKLVDRRDQAEGWYVPVHGQVLSEGKRTDGYKLFLYKDNVELGMLESNRKGRFELELDIDAKYTVRITKDGFQEKILVMDTSLPENLVSYPD